MVYGFRVCVCNAFNAAITKNLTAVHLVQFIDWPSGRAECNHMKAIALICGRIHGSHRMNGTTSRRWRPERRKEGHAGHWRRLKQTKKQVSGLWTWGSTTATAAMMIMIVMIRNWRIRRSVISGRKQIFPFPRFSTRFCYYQVESAGNTVRRTLIAWAKDCFSLG